MNLLCRLGRHRPRGIPRWNDGYYFATCARCGADLVRTAFQSWHVPSGYRVVWSDRPPASRPEVALMPREDDPPAAAGESGSRAELAQPADPPDAEPAPEADRDRSAGDERPVEPAAAPDETPVLSEGSRPGRLPIEEVLAQLNAEDSAEPARETATAPPEAPPRRRRSTWDFMDDDPFREGAPPGFAAGGRAPARETAPGPAPPGEPERDEAGPPRRDRGERWRRVRSALHNFWSGPDEPKPTLVIALALALALVITAAMALALRSAGSSSGASVASSKPGVRGDGAEIRERPDPFAASAPDLGEAEAEEAGGQGSEEAPAGLPEERGYVVASLLSCRDAPALQARRVRNLLRGQEVLVLSREGDWASLAFRGGQCWARAHFISPVPPL